MSELEPPYETLAWSHPLGAQLGGHPEVMRVPVDTTRAETDFVYPDLESYPDVRDVSRVEGLVTTVDGQTFTVASFLSRQAVNDTFKGRG